VRDTLDSARAVVVARHHLRKVFADNVRCDRAVPRLAGCCLQLCTVSGASSVRPRRCSRWVATRCSLSLVWVPPLGQSACPDLHYRQVFSAQFIK